LNILESIFQQHRYPTVQIVDNLVKQLNSLTQKITVTELYNSPASPPSNSSLHLPPPKSTVLKIRYPKKRIFLFRFSYPLSTPSFQSTITDVNNIFYTSEIISPFVFRDVCNHQHQSEFNGEL
jgi:hypothetical protein